MLFFSLFVSLGVVLQQQTGLLNQRLLTDYETVMEQATTELLCARRKAISPTTNPILTVLVLNCFFCRFSPQSSVWNAEILEMKSRSQDSSVGDVLDNRGTTVRCPKTVTQTVSGAHSTFYPMVSLWFCPGSEAAGAQSCHLSNGVSKKAWSYSSIAQMVPWCST